MKNKMSENSFDFLKAHYYKSFIFIDVFNGKKLSYLN
jgi:hypothetical protein